MIGSRTGRVRRLLLRAREARPACNAPLRARTHCRSSRAAGSRCGSTGRRQKAPGPSLRLILLSALLAFAPEAHLPGAFAQEARLTISGRPEILFDSLRDGCEPIDMPDINPRAFRDDKGQVVFFALHFVNRNLRGADLDHLKLDCHVVLPSHFDPEPAHYDDRSYITATWTIDGRNIAALVHHEYHADDHDRCAAKTSLACWYNSILAYRSNDGGTSFGKEKPLVVASAPFGQDVEQGRHRGFFNPSNIFSDGTHEYFFAATTGWQGQPYGACLFRTDNPMNPSSWRAFDGHGFNIRYADPYATKAAAPNSCAPIDPFVFPVGAVVRDRKSSLWIAVFQAAPNKESFPVEGFYYASSSDLLHWSQARLLLAGKTLFSDLCTAGRSVIAYPSLLDAHANSRNFDDVADDVYLYFTTIKINHCETGQRWLVREKISIGPDATRRP